MEHDYKEPLSKVAQKYFLKVQNEIKYCDNCQSWDGGEVNWILGEKISLSDLFESYNIPEKHWDQLASHMVCQGCGTDNFEPFYDIGINDEFDQKILDKISIGEKKYKRKIDDLIKFANENPSLILLNSLAKKIHKEIVSLTLPTWSAKNYICYRSRNVHDSKAFSSEDLDAPAEGISNIGRYNHAGKSAFYVSNTPQCSALEVLSDLSVPGVVWVQEYEIEEIFNILDLTIDWNEYYSLDSILFISLLNYRVFEQKSSKEKSTWKPEYLLTNFLSDCAKLSGYKGIRYSSVKGYEYNVVIFDKSAFKINIIGEPQILKTKAEKSKTFDLDF